MKRRSVMDLTRWMWRRTWPNYCRSCNGWGGAVPAGGDVVTDPCEDCLDRCSRCGADMFKDSERRSCNACGWNYMDGLPEEV